MPTCSASVWLLVAVACGLLLAPGPGPGAGPSCGPRLAGAMNLDQFAVVVISKSPEETIEQNGDIKCLTPRQEAKSERLKALRLLRGEQSPTQMFGYSVAVQDYLDNYELQSGSDSDRTRIRLLVGAPNFPFQFAYSPEPGFGLTYQCDIEENPAFRREKVPYQCKPREFAVERTGIPNVPYGFGDNPPFMMPNRSDVTPVKYMMWDQRSGHAVSLHTGKKATDTCLISCSPLSGTRYLSTAGGRSSRAPVVAASPSGSCRVTPPRPSLDDPGVSHDIEKSFVIRPCESLKQQHNASGLFAAENSELQCMAGFSMSLQKDMQVHIIGAPASANYSGLVAVYPDGLLTYSKLTRAKSDPGRLTEAPLYGIDRGPAHDYPRITGSPPTTPDGAPKSTPDSLLSYSVASSSKFARLETTGNLVIAAGSPRGDAHGEWCPAPSANDSAPADYCSGSLCRSYERRGQVVLFEALGANTSSPQSQLRQRMRLAGEQSYSFFGASLAFCDLNNDQLDDLIVGAPNFKIDLSGATSSARQVIPSAGKVYVYLQAPASNSEATLLPAAPSFTFLSSSARSGGFFGAALTCVGDTNNDGFKDLIVGEPGGGKEGHFAHGGIHLFLGRDFASEKRSSPPPTQSLYATDITQGQNWTNLSLFGSAFSQYDFDVNNFSDVVVSAPLSDAIAIVRAAPLLQINAFLGVDKVPGSMEGFVQLPGTVPMNFDYQHAGKFSQYPQFIHMCPPSRASDKPSQEQSEFCFSLRLCYSGFLTGTEMLAAKKHLMYSADRMAHPPKVLGEVVLEPDVASEARRLTFERMPENKLQWNESMYRFDTAPKLELSQQYWFREPIDFPEPTSNSAQPTICSSLYRVRFAKDSKFLLQNVNVSYKFYPMTYYSGWNERYDQKHQPNITANIPAAIDNLHSNFSGNQQFIPIFDCKNTQKCEPDLSIQVKCLAERFLVGDPKPLMFLVNITQNESSEYAINVRMSASLDKKNLTHLHLAPDQLLLYENISGWGSNEVFLPTYRRKRASCEVKQEMSVLECDIEKLLDYAMPATSVINSENEYEWPRILFPQYTKKYARYDHLQEDLYEKSSYIHFNLSLLVIQVNDEAFIGNQIKEIPFNFIVDSDTQDKNQANNRAFLKIPIYYEIGARVQGYCTPPNLELLNLDQKQQPSTVPDQKSILTVGIDVSNPATTKVPEMEVLLRVPWAVRYSSLQQRILNATGAKHSLAATSSSFVRLLELTSALGNHSVSDVHYSCPKFTDPLNPEQELQETRTNVQQNRVYLEFMAFGRRVQIVDRVIDSPSIHPVDLNVPLSCDPANPNADIICAEFRCTVLQLYGAKGYGEFVKNKDRNASIELQFRVLPRFYDIFNNLSKFLINFHTSANVTKLPLGVDISSVPFNSSWHSAQTFKMSTKLVKTLSDVIAIPLWIILASIFGGLLLLTFLFIILYFTGFFKRKRPLNAKEKAKHKKGGVAGDGQAEAGGENLALMDRAGGGAEDPATRAAPPEEPQYHPLNAPSEPYDKA